MRKLIEAHRFFMRKSQHYVMGNWSEHEIPTHRKWRYYRGFIPAYIKFMSYEIRDLLARESKE